MNVSVELEEEVLQVFGGQLIVVVPKHRLVVAVASQHTKDYPTNSQDVFGLVSDVILMTFH